MPSPTAWTFGQAVQMIIKMRRANPAVTNQHKLATSPDIVSQELIDYTNRRLGNPTPSLPKFSPPPISRQVAGAVADIKKLAQGAALLLEWQESGVAPVPSPQSTARAAVCLKCVKNSKAELTAWFTLPVSERIRAQLSRLNQMNLATPHDDALGVCSACLCPLKLKVHTPLELIQKRMNDKAKAELDASCWILNELAAAQR